MIVSDNPPTSYPETGSSTERDLESGDLWFDSFHVIMYIWYEDNTGGQWVATAIPGPKGEKGDKGDGADDIPEKTSDLINDGDDGLNPFINATDVGSGVISITKNDGTVIGTFNVNQSANSTISLPADTVPSAPGDGNLTIKENGGSVLGTFTANQATGNNTEVILPSIPANTSDLNNDSGFITNAGVTKIVAGTNVTINPANGTGEVTINSTGGGGGGFSGDYNDLTNKPDIPDATSDLTNDSGFITAADIPDIPENTSDLTNDSGFITAADLPTVGDGTITIKQGGAEKGVFTVNQGGDLEINLDAGGGTPSGDYVKIDDQGVAQTITGGGGLNIQFGTDTAQLGNIAPMNDWSCYPARA